jgi:hypothetical protein
VWLGRAFRVPLLPTETPSEYARRLSLRLPDEAGEIKYIANAFARSRYGPPDQNESNTKQEAGRVWKSLSLGLLRRRFGLGTQVQ